MKIDVLTLFPAMFAGPLDESIIKANAAGSVAGNIYSETAADKMGPSTALPRVYVPNHSSNTA